MIPYLLGLNVGKTKSKFRAQFFQADGSLAPASVFSEKKLRLGKPLGLPSQLFYAATRNKKGRLPR